jgi:hypothetical protein
VVHQGEDLLALMARCCIDEVGKVGRVQPSQLRVRYPQLDGWDVTGERLQARPVEEAGHADPVRVRTQEQASEQAAEADVDPDDPPPPLHPGDLDLVCAHQPGPLDVDQLSVENVRL